MQTHFESIQISPALSDILGGLHFCGKPTSEFTQSQSHFFFITRQTPIVPPQYSNIRACDAKTRTQHAKRGHSRRYLMPNYSNLPPSSAPCVIQFVDSSIGCHKIQALHSKVVAAAARSAVRSSGGRQTDYVGQCCNRRRRRQQQQLVSKQNHLNFNGNALSRSCDYCSLSTRRVTRQTNHRTQQCQQQF